MNKLSVLFSLPALLASVQPFQNAWALDQATDDSLEVTKEQQKTNPTKNYVYAGAGLLGVTGLTAIFANRLSAQSEEMNQLSAIIKFVSSIQNYFSSIGKDNSNGYAPFSGLDLYQYLQNLKFPLSQNIAALISTRYYSTYEKHFFIEMNAEKLNLPPGYFNSFLAQNIISYIEGHPEYRDFDPQKTWDPQSLYEYLFCLRDVPSEIKTDALDYDINKAMQRHREYIFKLLNDFFIYQDSTFIFSGKSFPPNFSFTNLRLLIQKSLRVVAINEEPEFVLQVTQGEKDAFINFMSLIKAITKDIEWTAAYEPTFFMQNKMLQKVLEDLNGKKLSKVQAVAAQLLEGFHAHLNVVQSQITR